MISSAVRVETYDVTLHYAYDIFQEKGVTVYLYSL